MAEHEEHDWVEQTKRGEPTAIGELYRRYWRAARAALRMQLGDNPVPAALGGVVHRWSILPESVCVVSLAIYLEPWASAHSGQVIELTQGTPFPSLSRQDHT